MTFMQTPPPALAPAQRGLIFLAATIGSFFFFKTVHWLTRPARVAYTASERPRCKRRARDG